MKFQHAQGTIEYLVILAVVIVIGLLMVSLLSDFFSSGAQIGVNSDQAKLQTGSIAVTEIITTPDGNYILELSPNTTGTSTITKIELDGYNQEFETNNTQKTGDKILYQITTPENCTPGSYTTKTITITYISTNGITQKQVYENIQIPCENATVDSSNINTGSSDTTPPSITLYLPLDGNEITNSDTNVDFIFSSNEKTKICNLYLDGQIYDTKNESVQADINITLDANVASLDFGTHEWYVTCTDNKDNLGTSEVREISYIEPPIENDYFIFLITTTEDNQDFNFQVDDASDLNINWGDGTIEIVNGTALRSHEYATAGDYNIWLQGSATRIAFSDLDPVTFSYVGTPSLLTDIYTPLSNGVSGITNAAYLLAFTEVNSFTEANFFDNSTEDVNDMQYAFWESDFNQDISNWNTSNVKNMYRTFGQSKFNQDISNWNVSNVENMAFLFVGSEFNQDINDWDVTSVLNFDFMFSSATFNQDIKGWDTTNAERMNFMFSGNTNYNQDLSDWNVDNVTACTQFSNGATAWVLPKPIFTNC